MTTTKIAVSQLFARSRGKALPLLSLAAALFGLANSCLGQGTMTITFQGPPRGVEWQVGGYNDPQSGMQFGTLTPQSLYLNGGGIPGYPDNGTCYLDIPAGSMRFGPNTFPPVNPIVPFNFLSFDAAEYDGAGPHTLTVVGYLPMAGTVTNYFTVNSQTFQTFHPDSHFTGVFQVDVLNASWSLDNIVVSGIPEPSTCTLAATAALCALTRACARRRRNHRNTPQHT